MALNKTLPEGTVHRMEVKSTDFAGKCSRLGEGLLFLSGDDRSVPLPRDVETQQRAALSHREVVIDLQIYRDARCGLVDAGTDCRRNTVKVIDIASEFVPEQAVEFSPSWRSTGVIGVPISNVRDLQRDAVGIPEFLASCRLGMDRECIEEIAQRDNFGLLIIGNTISNANVKVRRKDDLVTGPGGRAGWHKSLLPGMSAGPELTSLYGSLLRFATEGAHDDYE